MRGIGRPGAPQEYSAQPCVLWSMTKSHRFVRRVAVASTAATLLAAGTAAAVVGLPADNSQLNTDPAAAIDPHQNAGVSDIVGGSLAAGGARVPWATFEQAAGNGAQRI